MRYTRVVALPRQLALAFVVAGGLTGCNFRLEPVTVSDVAPGDLAAVGDDGGLVVDLGGGSASDDLGTLGPGDLGHVGPFIQVTPVLAPASVDLTAEGARDWAHWGFALASDFDHKKTGNGQISSFTQIGVNAPTQYADNLVAYHWSDGASGGGRHTTTPPAGTTTGIYVLTGGLQITAPADTTVRRLRVYVGQLNAQGQLDVSLSDNSATAASDHSHTSTGGMPVNVDYVITYAASSPGQLLTVRWSVLASSFGSITLQSATLE
jgi:hypothetical protein